MTNEERRIALNLARRKALEHAEAAESTAALLSSLTAEELANVSLAGVLDPIAMAQMWALVAEAMKDGDPDHDGADGGAYGIAELRQRLTGGTS